MLSEKQAAYWQKRLEATTTNRSRALALWDLIRVLAGSDERVWADLVRGLQGWVQARTGQSDSGKAA